MAITPDDRLVFATMTGYGYITSWRLDGKVLSIAKDPACPKVPGDGTFRGIEGIVGSDPNGICLTQDGAYLYRIYGNASKLVGYAVQPDGSLDEVTSASVPAQQPAALDRILIPPQRLKTTRVVTVVVLRVASAWALQSSLRAEQAVNRRPMKIERSSPI